MAKPKQSKYAQKGGFHYSEQFQAWERAMKNPNASQVEREELSQRHVELCKRLYGV